MLAYKEEIDPHLLEGPYQTLLCATFFFLLLLQIDRFEMTIMENILYIAILLPPDFWSPIHCHKAALRTLRHYLPSSMYKSSQTPAIG